MREQIVAAARKLDLVEDSGALKTLDSLSIIDFVVELEATLAISIPSSALKAESFTSFETVESMLEELKD